MVYRRNAEIKKIAEKYVRKKEKKEKGKTVSTYTDEEWEENADSKKQSEDQKCNHFRTHKWLRSKEIRKDITQK